MLRHTGATDPGADVRQPGEGSTAVEAGAAFGRLNRPELRPGDEVHGALSVVRLIAALSACTSFANYNKAPNDNPMAQIVSLVVEEACIVHGKARAKRLAAGWGRFTWPGCPPGGVEATAEAVLKNLTDNFLSDAVAPGTVYRCTV